MDRRTRIIAAGALAMICALLVYSFLSSLRPTATVVVAAKDIAQRTAVSADMLRLVRVDPASRDKLAAGAYQTLDDLKGMVAIRPIRSGEVLRMGNNEVVKAGDLAELAADHEVSISNLIPPGMRAVVIPIGVQLPVRAGDFIDLFETTMAGIGSASQSNLLLPGINIFIVDRGGDKDGPVRSVTVLVKEGEEVRRVLAALKSSTVDVVLAPTAVVKK